MWVNVVILKGSSRHRHHGDPGVDGLYGLPQLVHY